MVEYPIRIARVPYRGNNAAKRMKVNALNRIVDELERGINAMVEKQETPFHAYIYGQIAYELGYPVETVRDLCMSIDGGHNGFTVVKPGMTYTQAMAAVDAARESGA